MMEIADTHSKVKKKDQVSSSPWTTVADDYCQYENLPYAFLDSR